MTSQIRVDEITNRSGLGTVTIYDNGFEFTGVTTFTEDVDITGGLTIGGVLTYEDTTNIDSVGLITARAGVKVPDSQKIFLGTGDDLQIYHSGGDSYITNSDGNLNVVNSTDGWIRLQPKSGEEGVIVKYDGAVELYHDNSLKLSTAAGGVNVAGNINLNSADGYEIRLGANNDLKLYHDGSNSYVQDAGTGNLILSGTRVNLLNPAANETMVSAQADGPVELYHNNVKKLETTTSGVAIHEGTDKVVRFTGAIGEIGDVTGFQASNTAGNALTDLGMRGTTLRFATGSAERLRITSAGRMGVGTNDPNALLEVRDSENTTQGNAQIRISKGVGAAAAPATITRANTYLHLGGTEWGSGANGKYLIGLGYTNDEVGTGIPAYMGFTETSVGGYTKGDLIFGTRGNTTGTDNPTERLRITSDGKVGINETSPTALLDINHPNTEQGLKVRSRYGNIATAMVKFDSDPQSDGGDGNVLHLHGGSSRTDSEILHIDSTGAGDIFDIRGDGLTRIYKQLQLEHSSNVAKIIFNEYGANDPKAQIEMDQLSGSSGQLIFRTQQSGTLAQRLRISSGGTLYYNGEAQTVASSGGSAHKVLVTSAYEEWHFTWSGQSSRTATFTCPSYFHAEVIYTSHQTNGGTNIHRYIRGKWANNHTHHEWNVFEDNGNTWGLTSFSITVGQNTSSASGKLTISETYGSGSLSNRAVIMRIYYGASGLGWDIA